MKKLEWLGTSYNDMMNFSKNARKNSGFQLKMIQLGLEPLDYKSMPSVGTGVYEIRIHAENEYRIIYVAKFAGKIYVLHCFIKKSNKTPSRDMQLARTRFKNLIGSRKIHEIG